MKRILSGIQPTGIPHLGNYLGTLSSWVNLQNTHDCLFSIADLHSLTIPQDAKKLKSNQIKLAASLIAIGLDSKKCILFRQSQVSQHTELAWILFCFTPFGWLRNMHQWKTKVSLLHNPSDDLLENNESLNIGLLSYPVLQTADILLYKATHVPVGEDQVQHLHLASMIAKKFNFHTNSSIFPLPKKMIASDSAKRIMSLKDPTQKMSKSDPSVGSRISLTDTPDEIRSKIRKATSDSILGITYEPENRPGTANLIDIMATVTGMEPLSLAHECHHMSNKQFKDKVAESLISVIDPIRLKIEELEKEQDYLLQILSNGEEKARALAEKTMLQVREAVGI